MEQKKLSTLLTKHVNGSLSQSEFATLRTFLAEFDEAIIESCLYEVWQDYTPLAERNTAAFEKVKANLKKIIRPLEKSSPEVRSALPGKLVIHPFFKYAAIVLLPIILGLGVYYFTRESVEREFASNIYTIETANGERMRITLPDGTRVQVSANSIFSYPAVFGRKNREVNLSGEAFFDVMHNPDQPFIVKTKEISVKVLGTKFNLNAYPGEQFAEASLVEGKIEAFLNRDHTKRMEVNPNEKVRYDYAKAGFEHSKTDLEVETAWTRGELYFQSENMHIILPKLERYFGVKFHIAGRSPDRALTASYRETDVNDILRNLAIHYRFSYTKNGDIIYLNFR